MGRSRVAGYRRDERGFTLQELLVTIAILGILIAIAIIIWLGLLEQRRVTAAANQIAADMRLVHNKASTQLTDWRIVLAPERSDEDPDGPDYYLVRLTRPYDEPKPYTTCATNEVEVIPRTFPANVKIRNHKANLNDATPADPAWVELSGADPDPKPSRSLEFNSDGTMAFKAGPSGSVCVTVDEDPEIRVTALSATSRVEIKDEDCEEVDEDL